MSVDPIEAENHSPNENPSSRDAEEDLTVGESIAGAIFWICVAGGLAYLWIGWISTVPTSTVLLIYVAMKMNEKNK